MAEPRTSEGPQRTWERRLAEGSLSYQRCTACDAAVFPPRVACPACGVPALEWRESAGRGELYSISWLAPRDAEPYNVALVDLDEGFRLMARLEGAGPGETVIGMRVHVRAGVLGDAPAALARPEAGGDA